jgi:CHAD domain-containing protein
MSDSRPATLGRAVHALARKQCRSAQRALAGRRHPHESVHAARKAIRRLRAVLSLANDRFDAVESVDRELRSLGRGLSQLRDAHVIASAARRLAARGDAAAWAPAIACLEQRREQMLAEAMASDPRFARRRARLGHALDRLADLPWDDLTPGDIDKAMRRSAKRVVKAQARARSEASAEIIHTWRRRTRRLRMQLEAVRHLRLDAPISAKHRLEKFASAKEVKTLRALADRLGDFQDLQLLQRVLRRLRVLHGHPALQAQLQDEIAALSP